MANSHFWNPKLYNDKHAFVYHFGAALLGWLAPQPDERILDLGCGSGQLTQKMHELGCQVVGLDNSPEMISAAQAQFPAVPFQVGDAVDFHLDPPFDAIFSNATLHWVTDYAAAIRCMYGNLKPGGRIVVEFGGKGNIQHIEGALRQALADRGYAQQAALRQWYFPSIGEYASALEAQGFRVLQAQHFDRPTELTDTENGIMDWLDMFGNAFFEGVPEHEVQAIQQEVQAAVKPTCFYDGKWHADYKRIRVKAIKEPFKST